MKNRKSRWIALTAVASLVVLVAGWFLLISPKRSDVSSVKADAQKAEQHNNELQTNLSILRGQQKDLAKERAQLQAAALKIPTAPDLPALLRQLSAAADTTGVEFNSITPALPSALTAVPGISTIGLSISVTGGYFNVENYVHTLEGLDRALLVTGFTLAPAQSSGASGTSGSAAVVTATTSTVDPSTVVTATISAEVFTGSVTAATQAVKPAGTTGSAGSTGSSSSAPTNG